MSSLEMENASRILKLEENVTKLMAFREGDIKGASVMVDQLVLITRELQIQTLKMNTLETERRVTVIIAGAIGAFVAWVMQVLVGLTKRA